MKKIKWLLFIGVAYFWAAGVVFSASPALLKSGDVLTITVKGEPELSCDRLIAPDGSITMPLIGSVGVAGMKTTDAAQLIKQQLEDGFLKNPVVTVSSKSFSSNTNAKSIEKNIPVSTMSEADMTYAVVDDTPLGLMEDSDEYEESPKSETSDEQVLIEIRDVVSNKGIADAVLSVDNRVYQTNRLGQILINRTNGRAVVLADGYKTLAGNLSGMVKEATAGNPAFITLEKIRFNETILCTVIDANNRKPVRNAEVSLEGGKVTTNSRGEFKISGIKKEFGEVVIKKRGYAVKKSVIDYKGPTVITIELTK